MRKAAESARHGSMEAGADMKSESVEGNLSPLKGQWARLRGLYGSLASRLKH